MSRYKAYPEYAQSGAGLVDELPAGWRTLRGKYVFSEYSERSEAGEEQLLSVSEYYGVKPRGEVIEEGDFLSRAESLAGYKKCQKDDLVMNIMLAWKCGLGVSKYDGIVSPAYSVFRFNGDAIPDYMHYLLRTETYTGHFKTRSTGVIDSRLRLYPESFGDVSIMLPPTSEQEKIVAFLDHETAKIDALIEKQQWLIELLKEKRQAVISHAVTKGLNPNASMKDSGVEWLGEVPAHWGTTYLKYATSMIVDCPHETPVYSEDGQYLVIRTADLNEGCLDSSKMYRVEEDEYILRIRRAGLRQGDIVYGREGERWGHAGLVPKDGRYCLGQRMMQFRANLDFCPDFLMWLLNSDNVYKQGQVDTVGATSPHVNVGTIRNFSLTQPPLVEQREISRFLNEKTHRFDALIDQAFNTVSLLQERRTALISAAVTGKIDVRDWQPAAA